MEINVSENTEVCSSLQISSLPIEMLEKIFQFLTARERNTAKLVCRKWDDICNLSSFANYGKLYFSGLDPESQVIKAMESICLMPNTIQFYKTDLKSSSVDFWKVCGARLRHLQLQSCDIDRSTVRRIIRHCPKLMSLEWSADISFFDDQLFDRLLQNNIVVRSLRNLVVTEKLCSSDQPITVELLQRIFVVFPSISKFTILFGKALSSEYCESFNEFRALHPEMADRFDIHLLFPDDRIYFWTGISRQTERMLNSLKISEVSLMNLPSTEPPELQQLQTVRGGLETFRVSIMSWAATAPVFEFLQGCSSLRHLHIMFDDDMRMNMKMVKTLLEMPLQSLYLHFKYYGTAEECEYGSLPLPINNTLRKFGITYTQKRPLSKEHIHAVALLRQYRALTHLSLCNVTNAELEAVIEHQRRLEMLELHFGKNCSPLPTYCSPFFKLQSLKHVIITMEKVDPSLESFFQALQFPHVQYVRVAQTWDYEESEYPPKFLYSIGNLVNVESVNLSCEFSRFEEIIKFCGRLKKLRFLRICFSYKMSEDQIDTLFRKCPSLRSFAYSWRIIEDDYLMTDAKAYKYDFFEKKVTEQKHHLVTNPLCQPHTCNHGWGTMTWDEDVI